MTDTINYKPLQILRIKDIQNLLAVSESTAKRYLSDIRLSYNVDKVTYLHFCKYFKI